MNGHGLGSRRVGCSSNFGFVSSSEAVRLLIQRAKVVVVPDPVRGTYSKPKRRAKTFCDGAGASRLVCQLEGLFSSSAPSTTDSMRR